MMDIRVRAHWVTSAAGFIKMHFPPDVGGRLLSSLPDEVRRSLTDLEPVQWCPRSHHVEVMSAIASVPRAETAAYENLVAYGQYVGAQRLLGSLRPFMQIATLKIFAKNLPKIWALDHPDESRLEVDISQLDEARLVLRVCDVGGYDHAGVAMLGWVKHGLTQFSRRNVQVKQAGWSLLDPGPDQLEGEVSWS